MSRVTLTVNVPEFTEEELRAAVLEACVERILGVVTEEDISQDCFSGEPVSQGKVKRDGTSIAELRQEAKDITVRKVREVVEAKTEAVVTEVLAGEFQPVTRFGDRQKTTTLREMIGTFGMEYLTAQVNEHGSPAGSFENKAQPRLHYLVKKLTEDVYAQELKKEVDAAVAEFKKSMAGKVSGEITETVQRLLGLK